MVGQLHVYESHYLPKLRIANILVSYTAQKFLTLLLEQFLYMSPLIALHLQNILLEALGIVGS
jgi:hypothetical protein